tara:strand:+ start:956 stop:1498 length:543 start_codon:yes stop_codon:yes gene_type:complete
MSWRDILKVEEDDVKERVYDILEVFDDLGKDSSLSHETITSKFPQEMLKEKGIDSNTIKDFQTKDSGYDSPSSFIHGSSPKEVIDTVDNEWCRGFIEELQTRQGKFGTDYVAFDNIVPSTDRNKNSGNGMEFFLQLEKKRFMSGFQYNSHDEDLRKLIAPYIFTKLIPYQKRYGKLLERT